MMQRMSQSYLLALLSFSVARDRIMAAVAFQGPRLVSRSLPGQPRHTLFKQKKKSLSRTSIGPLFHVADLHDPDFLEELIGGQRYEMVPLPDSMMDTTLFVGNLDEFVKDKDLSDLFQEASVLNSVPACVVRKANYESLRYGFVAFPNAEEKETAIIRFHGSEWNGKSIKVEPIRDHPKMGRVRVPESIVSYVSGAAKKTRNGKVNTMRRSREVARPGKKGSKLAAKEQRKKNKKKRQPFPLHNLVSHDLQEFYRASRKGFLTLPGTGYRRGRKSCLLANTHRQWCDERNKPQIVLCKASGGRPLDNIIVDLSPIRIAPDDPMLVQWKAQILLASKHAEMVLRPDYEEDNCEVLSSLETSEQEDCLVYEIDGGEIQMECDTTAQQQQRRSSPDASTAISDMPALSLGVFEGERSKAKAMARELAQLWAIPEEPQIVENLDDRNRNKQWKKKSHQRRGRNVRDLQWYAGT